MTSLTDERTAFEKWGDAEFMYGFHPETWENDAPCEYGHECTQMAWEGWQARATRKGIQASPIPEPPAALFFNAMEGHSGKRPIWSELGSTHDPKLFPIYELRLATPELGEDK